MAYIQVQSKVIKAVRSSISATGRVKPAELAWSLVSLAAIDGRLYLEDVKAAFDAVGANNGDQVKWESVVRAIKDTIRCANAGARGIPDGVYTVVNNDFITYQAS